MTKPLYFLVEMPDVGTSMTWIGGGLKLSKRAGYVWLTRPNGDPVLEVQRQHVRPTNPEELTKRIIAERLTDNAPLN